MDVTTALRKLRTRVDAMVARAVVTGVNGALKTVRLQLTITADEVEPNVELMQGYGVSFTPPAGAEALVLAVQGARSHSVAIMAQHPDERPTDAKAREGGLYNAGKWRVFVDAEGTVCVGDKDSGEHVPLGDLLVRLIQDHTHATSMGPSGPPLNAIEFARALSKHKIAP